MATTAEMEASVEEGRCSTRAAACLLIASGLMEHCAALLHHSTPERRPPGHAPPPKVGTAGALQCVGAVWRALRLVCGAHMAFSDCCEVERARTDLLRAPSREITRIPRDLPARSAGGPPTLRVRCTEQKIDMFARMPPPLIRRGESGAICLRISCRCASI